MGATQSAPVGASDSIGRLVFKGTGCCNDNPPYNFADGNCCDPASQSCCDASRPPTGERWEAARAELKVLLGEVNDAIVDLDKQCCFSPKPDLENVKSTLISKGWLSKVNTILAKHGLVADLNAFWIYNGQSASQHMAMRIYNLNAATAATTAAQAATIAPVIQSNNMN